MKGIYLVALGFVLIGLYVWAVTANYAECREVFSAGYCIRQILWK